MINLPTRPYHQSLRFSDTVRHAANNE